MRFYGDTQDANAPSAPSTVSIGHDLTEFESGGGSNSGGGQLDTSIGKGSVDFGNLLGSIGDTVGNIAKGVGSIGIPGGPNIGGVAAVPGQAIGGALGAVGGITLPYLGNDPNRQAAHLGDVPGAVLGTAGEVLGAPERFVESHVAQARLGNQPLTVEQATRIAHNTGRTVDQVMSAAAIPQDIQARLDAGESVNTLAEDMARSNRGFSNDGLVNLAGSLLLDPMNLLSFGVGKIATVAKGADAALQAGREIGVGERFMGKAYGAASRGLSAGGASLMDHVLGPTTSGIFHALGTRPYKAILSGVSRIDRQYGQAFEDAFARGAAQYPRAVIARYLGDEVKAGIAKVGNQVGQSIEARLGALQKIAPQQLQRRVEELAARVAPDFAGHTDEARFIETRDKLAQITGMSSEDAARALGNKADLRTAQQVHLAFYGKAGDDLARAKAASALDKTIDAERLTLVAPDTLTKDAAARIISGAEDIPSAVDKYSILRNRFGDTAYDHEEVLDFIRKLDDQDALVSTVVKDTTRKNPLPKALGDWRGTYNKFGYEVGFAPKDGWKTITTADGDVLYGDPFVHFVSEADPLTMRNPLGRFTDSLMRGTTQTSIILDSRNRFVQVTKGAGISANEARTIHQRILDAAHDAGFSPRGLSLLQATGKESPYRAIVRDVLGEDRFKQFVQHVDPDFAVMQAFEGNLSRVGLTQKVTGVLKTKTAGHGNTVAAIAEGVYPTVRFRLSPLFQAQEAIESPFFNLIRGAHDRAVPEDVARIYNEMSQLPDFKYLSEAGYVLNIAGNREVARTISAKTSLLGKALPEKFVDVARGKERARITQVFSEHPEAFKDAVNQINPKLWATMEDAYKTTDAGVIADNFIRERMALASGDLDEAMATFDAVQPAFIQALYDEGRVAAGQAGNIAAGVARGANGAGGAMKLTAEELARVGAQPLAQSHDAETVWQAFRESFRQTSQQAFKTHFFNPERGFLERSINHPYLGIYPASYMWGKVAPEFARFLFKRPFGLNAPLLGIDAYQRVQQTVIASLAMDPELKKWVDKSGKDGSLYIIDQLLPATPGNIPANLPAWERHLAQNIDAGKKIDPQRFATEQAGDMAQNAFGPLKSFNAVAGAAGDFGDIFQRLTHAASQLDAQFPRR